MTTTFNVTYQSNYNGCHIESSNLTIDQNVLESIESKVCDFAHPMCSEEEEGQFYGDIDAVEDEAKRLIIEQFGTDVVIEFEEDGLST